MNERLSIKTVGFVDGKWEIILSNGDILDRVTNMEVRKTVGDFGRVTLEAYLDNSNRFSIPD